MTLPPAGIHGPAERETELAERLRHIWRVRAEMAYDSLLAHAPYLLLFLLPRQRAVRQVRGSMERYIYEIKCSS